ncbi:SDR family NAD(P)-dependent oxidoreductase [Ferruginibacter albus]|uniref:SDR family NAD(P)-dependent oxidoreductase n=1 Tax=Ferruginibacter albus TaxID=2875540 RepID=UPI001CC64B26|nr:SDR family oxidoreductase [Ferruginibacter albus]UAY53375.1 SDR family oxidoreductase [Ferruginibacter albus]
MSYALITGGSKGIGKAIAIELAKKKINILLVARTEAELQITTTEIKRNYGVEVDYLATDLSLPHAASFVLDWCKAKKYTIHILVNNAGYGLSGLFESHTLQSNTNMLQLNMITTTQMCHTFLPMLKQQPKAYILNIASSAAYQAVPYLSLYAATKVFVLYFSRGLSHELKGSSVSVTCVSPGPTDTDFPNRAQLTEKAAKAAEKFHVPPQQVAVAAVKAMFARKREVVTGFVNKLAAFLAWLAPKSITESTASKIYK